MNNYAAFLASKRLTAPTVGFEVDVGSLNQRMFPFQRDIVRWGIRRGRAGIFLDTGLGKTIAQLEIADHVCRQTGGRFLLLTPLAVSRQTLLEAGKFGIQTPVKVAAAQENVGDGITVTNYEKLHRFDPSEFVGVGLDEASILKSFDGKTRNSLIESFASTPYRYVYTATPSPNDTDELGNYAEFLGIMSLAEMRAMFFTHDGGDTSKWRLRGHGEKAFFKFMAQWAVMLRKPSDIGYSDEGYNLPPLNITHHEVESSSTPAGMLFITEARTLADQRAASRDTIEGRVETVANLSKGSDPWVIWCNLNDESKAAAKAIGGTEITGSQKESEKEIRLIDFAECRRRVLVTKPTIAGFGLNWQHCHNMAFVGLSHSYEQFYQAVRRCWRFGQQHPVNVHIVSSDRDGAILANIQRKQAESDRLTAGIVEAMAEHTREQIGGAERQRTEYNPTRKVRRALWNHKPKHCA